jgi:primosomal protein N'
MKIPILLPNIFNHPFTYDSDLNLKVGDYVIVPFGKSEVTGVVWDELEKKKSLIHFYMDKKNKVYSYRLVFSNRDDLINFQHSIKDDKRIISVRGDMQS